MFKKLFVILYHNKHGIDLGFHFGEKEEIPSDDILIVKKFCELDLDKIDKVDLFNGVDYIEIRGPFDINNYQPCKY